jgi:hypothetical protein
MSYPDGAELLIFHCWACKAPTSGCPSCVASLPIDPHTNLPPDVMRSSKGFEWIEPDRAALARAVKQPICEECAAAGGADAAGVRHDRHCNLS